MRAGGRVEENLGQWRIQRRDVELWPQTPSRSIFLPPKAPSALVMAARQELSEVVPQEMRDRRAERPTELWFPLSRGFFIFLCVFCLSGVVEVEARNVWKASKLVPAGVGQLEQTGTNIFTCLLVHLKRKKKNHVYMLSMLICTTHPFIPPISWHCVSLH